MIPWAQPLNLGQICDSVFLFPLIVMGVHRAGGNLRKKPENQNPALERMRSARILKLSPSSWFADSSQPFVDGLVLGQMNHPMASAFSIAFAWFVADIARQRFVEFRRPSKTLRTEGLVDFEVFGAFVSAIQRFA